MMEATELRRLIDPSWTIRTDLSRRGDNLARRLGLAIRSLITAGLITPGSRLPSERQLAEVLSVSRPTITSAIDDLKSQGLVESRQGSGTWVSRREVSDASVPTMAEVVLIDQGINLAAAAPPDPSHLGQLSIDLGDMLTVTPGHGYDPLGLERLRRRIADRYCALGIETGPEQIMVTPGAHGALSLCVGAMVGRGDRVIVEAHTYGGMLDLLTKAKARAVAVERDREGMVPADLDRLISRHGPRLVFLMPTVHAPTGVATTARRLGELAAVLDRHRVVVVADEALGDLVASGVRGATLNTLCRSAPVIDVGSLSKVAWGGLRIGWLRMPAVLRDVLMHHRSHVELGASVPSQLLATKLCDRLEPLIEDRRRTLLDRGMRLAASLGALLPEWNLGVPDGGVCLWAELPLRDSSQFVAAAAREGVAVMAGSMARADRAADRHVRICFDRTGNELELGALRLCAAWEYMNARGPGPERNRVLGDSR